ncbi:hypothetical protein EDD17DRAFT_1043735 [Pisolithus thermaeus]|nr:hypothetical protein EDD17DRAFT_1043735 [Pisolithus thermaeus]
MKYDMLLTEMAMQKKADPCAAAKQYLQKNCIRPIQDFVKCAPLSYVAVSSNPGYERERNQLIELTHDMVTATFGLYLGAPSSVPVLTQMAQRVSRSLKIEGSITVGKQRYWRTPTDDTLLDCLAAIHTDIVCVWNFNDPSRHLSSNEFREIMISLAWTIDGSSGESAPIVLPPSRGPALLRRVHGALDVRYKFMAYIIHLVHVLEMLFALTANNNGKKLTRGAISSAFNAYYHSSTRCNADMEVRSFDTEIPHRDTVLEKIATLIKTSPIDEPANIGVLDCISRKELEKDEWHIDADASERRERLAFLANLVNNLNVQFDRHGGVDVLTDIITHQREILDLTPSWHRERLACLVHLANSLGKLFRMKGNRADLTEIISLQRTALQLTPQGHQERVVSLVNLANSLHEQFKKDDGMEDLTEIITLRRVVLQLTPPEHPDYLVSLSKLSDYLDQRFDRKHDIDDLTEVITLQRTALQLTPPGHQGRFLSLVNLSKSLHERFIKGGTLADLDEIIAFRRATLECTPPTPSDRCMSLLNLANTLREKYQRLGMDADLAEAIKHACATLVRCPLEHVSLCRDCVASCVELRAKKSRMSVPPVQAIDSDTTSSGVKQMVRSIATEVTKTLPLRLLNTHTGTLYDRDAQMSYFEDSAQYHELLSSTDGSTGCDLSVRKTVSKFFGYTTLSHKWGTGEVSLRNIQGNSVYDIDGGEGFAKLQNFCALTLRHGYTWAWSDTCCIDKESSSELQEAIGSMFSWYRDSALTIVHLSDVSGTASFTNSVWFRRGWTLQELLAPPRLLFYIQDWTLYMDCRSPNHKTERAILMEIQKATGIGELQLSNFSPGVDDPRSKLRWASTRHTTRPEDVAYSLFGIFQTPLPIIYSESAQTALGRLLVEIISRSGDVSALDWVGEASSFHSCFPASLEPYHTVPQMQLEVLSDPAKHNEVDIEKKQKLYKVLAQLPSPRFIGRRLVLPCIVHHVIRVKLLATSSTTSSYDYEIVAPSLVPLKLTLSSRLQEGSGTDLPYTLIRPWSPKLLDLLAHGDGPGSLLEWLGQPFNALLLKSSLHNEYKRIMPDRFINVSVEDPASVVNSECRILEIV